MTRKEAIESLRGILTEAVEFENSVCYVTEEDREPLEMAIKALEQEPCEDTISRQAVLDIVDSYSESQSNVEDVTQDIISDIVVLPPVNPTKTGHWIFVDKAHEHAHCSECDYGDVDLMDGRPHNYCPNCGCRMIDPQESEG